MNKLRNIGPLLLVALIIGCATFEKNAYRTIGSIATTVEASRKAWVDYVVGQRVVLTGNPTEAAKLEQQVAKVGVEYAKYQTAMQAANAAVLALKSGSGSQNATEAALQAVAAASGSVISLIKQASGK